MTKLFPEEDNEKANLYRRKWCLSMVRDTDEHDKTYENESTRDTTPHGENIFKRV